MNSLEGAIASESPPEDADLDRRGNLSPPTRPDDSDDDNVKLLSDHAISHDRAIPTLNAHMPSFSPPISTRDDDDLILPEAPQSQTRRRFAPPATRPPRGIASEAPSPTPIAHVAPFVQVVEPAFDAAASSNNTVRRTTTDLSADLLTALPSESCDGVVNRRLSWAERRSRYRVRSDSMTDLTEENQHDNPASGFQYTEFMKDSEPCPSCGGDGLIDREAEANLVAVIPYHDDRLRPKRPTWFYVGVGVTISVFLAVFTLFFLYPRIITISSERKRLEPLHVTINTNTSGESVYLDLQNEFTVANPNFVPVTFASVTMRSTVFEKLLNTTTNNTAVSVPPRSTISVYVTTHLSMDRQNSLGFIAPYCADPRRYMHTFTFVFDVAAQASVLGHSQDMTLRVHQHVSCGHDTDQSSSQNLLYSDINR